MQAIEKLAPFPMFPRCTYCSILYDLDPVTLGDRTFSQTLDGTAAVVEFGFDLFESLLDARNGQATLEIFFPG